MDLAYTFYMAENEGLLPTRFGNINAAIADIKRHPSESIDMDEFECILNAHDLSFSDLTQAEKNYIDASIA